jgi:hypothetical protein
VRWKKYLTVGQPIPHEARVLLPQISDMVVFDFLINNVDRFSGANIKASPDGNHLYFMDNALSFIPQPEGNVVTRSMLSRVQKFSASLYTALVALDEPTLRAAMARDTGPWPTLLEEDELAALMIRRDKLVRYIDGLVAEHGSDAVLVFP